MQPMHTRPELQTLGAALRGLAALLGDDPAAYGAIAEGIAAMLDRQQVELDRQQAQLDRLARRIEGEASPPNLAQLRDARLAEMAARPATPDEIGAMVYDPLVCESLGRGLTREWSVCTHREAATAPIELLGTVEAFALDLGDGQRIAIEIEADLDCVGVGRRVHITFPRRDVVDSSNTAQQLLQLAKLLGRPEVVEALTRWTAEDAAAHK